MPYEPRMLDKIIVQVVRSLHKACRLERKSSKFFTWRPLGNQNLRIAA